MIYYIYYKNRTQSARKNTQYELTGTQKLKRASI